jgi:hypothetical protein
MNVNGTIMPPSGNHPEQIYLFLVETIVIIHRSNLPEDARLDGVPP